MGRLSSRLRPGVAPWRPFHFQQAIPENDTMSTAAPAQKPVDTRGLAGQTVGETSICAVNQTQLIYRGYEIADLAANATFEEVAFLLLVGHKPSTAELAAFTAEIASMRAIPASVRDAIVRVAKESPNAHPMSILRTGVSLLSHLDPDCEDNSPAAELRKSKRLLAQIPSIIGACQRTLDGKTPVDPDPSLGHAANLMWMMSGEKPGELAARIMDVSLILYAEHDFNASTFSCRVISSTETDMHSAVCGGIGTMSGRGEQRSGQRMADDNQNECSQAQPAKTEQAEAGPIFVSNLLSFSAGHDRSRKLSGCKLAGVGEKVQRV